MPHEKIITTQTARNVETDEITEHRSEIVVQWNLEDYAQLGVINEAAPDGQFTLALDRRNINDLIKALRRARAQVFGPDE